VAPHSQANKELALMVEKGGMSPRDALIAATKGGPDLMDLAAETGTLDPGKSADLIAVEGDPLVDPTAVQRVHYVMVRGNPIPMKGAE
jgi:imidazolonepropionase-like amidohydrolase